MVLNEEIFNQCEQNCLPMKIFRDMFLRGGIAFDIANMFQGDDSLKYSWLASLLLNINNMQSLNNFPDLKKQLMVFQEVEVIPAVIVATKMGKKGLVLNLV